MLLNTQQTKEVAHYLATFENLNNATSEELLDHLCSDIENAMLNGSSFEEAFSNSQKRCNESEVKKIHSSNKSKLTMAKLIIGLCLFASATYSFFQQTETVDPPEKTVLYIEPPTICPLSGSDFKVSSPYGMAIHPLTNKERMHVGIDLRAAFGTPIQAAGTGIVLEAGKKDKYGYCIIIKHDETYQTLYAHLQSIAIKTGDTVTAGQCIGYVGSSGLSTGPHLHYEVIKDGVNVNPAQYLP